MKEGEMYYWIRFCICAAITCFISLPATIIAADTIDARIYIADRNGAVVYVLNSAMVIERVLPAETASAYTFAAYDSRIYCIDSLNIDVLDKQTLSNLDSFLYDCQMSPGWGKARITPDGKKMYVGGVGSGKAATSGIFVIDLTTNEQTKVISQNGINSGLLDISPDGKHLYYAGEGITVLNTNDDSLLKVIALRPKEIAYDIVAGEGDLLFASLYTYPEDSSPAEASILAVDISKNTEKRFPLKAGRLKLLYVSGRKLYALGSKALYEIDASDLRIITTFAISGTDLALTPDGKKLLVVSPTTSEVITLDLSNGDAISRNKVGAEPYALLVF
jgi:DNA-binding beta-propeller fold protein YncE